MTDLDALFAGVRTTTLTDPSVADADVARGRRALTLRRMRRSGGRTALVAAVAVGGFAALHPQGSSGSHTAAGGATATSGTSTTTTATAPRPTAISHPSTTIASIRLVAYTGQQPQGYTVGEVPAGWVIQGVSDYVLTIAPDGDKNTDPDSFLGKIAVMLQSKDEQGVPHGQSVDVAGRPGTVVTDDPNISALFYTDDSGHRVDIEYPTFLHWSAAQAAAFGASVHVNASAAPGEG